MDESRSAPVSHLYALKAYYRVVYLNGLGLPTELLIGSGEELDVESTEALDTFCQYIQGSIDLDCRRVLFVYRDKIDGQ